MDKQILMANYHGKNFGVQKVQNNIYYSDSQHKAYVLKKTKKLTNDVFIVEEQWFKVHQVITLGLLNKLWRVAFFL